LMDPLGLVVLDDQIFLNRVVKRGLDIGVFTRDRADEIIRVSVAMANKYVLEKEVDFRSAEELARVQQTILKLIGVGLEMRAKGDPDLGVSVLMEDSPVDLFRLAYTRIEKLRRQWQLLQEDHRVEILVSMDEYQCMTDLTCQRLSNMSVFSDAETEAIRSAKLGDELFSTVAVLNYYEQELAHFEFIRRLKNLLPFGLLNKSPNVRAENLAEVDCLRAALVNTLIISGFVESADPVAVTLADVRKFLEMLDRPESPELFPEDFENALLDLIHELGSGLDESEAALLTREIVQLGQDLLSTIMKESHAVNSVSETAFFKRWCRLAVLSDGLDPLSRILSTDGPIDEFDIAIIAEQFANRPEDDGLDLAAKLPWERLRPDQVIRLFHDAPQYQAAFARAVSLANFGASELVDLLEVIESGTVLKKLRPALEKVIPNLVFSLEDLESLAALLDKPAAGLIRKAKIPADYDAGRIFTEFREGSEQLRRALLLSSWGSAVFPELVLDACVLSPTFIKKFVKDLAVSDVGPFLAAANGGRKPKIRDPKAEKPRPQFKSEELNVLFDSLTPPRKKAALTYFQEQSNRAAKTGPVRSRG
jgi:hypothetical protein